MSRIIPTFDFTKHLDNDLGFSFYKLEESYTNYNATQPHRHNYYEILYFNEEGGMHEIDFNMHKIQSNSIHFVSPQQVHLLRRKKNVTGSVLSFSDDFFLEPLAGKRFTDTLPFFNDQYINPVIQLNLKDQIDECRFHFDKMRGELASEKTDKLLALQSWLKLFLILCRRLHTGTPVERTFSVSKSEITCNFKKLVEKEYRKIKTVSDYAALLNITPGHLSDIVQKDTGRTAGEFIHDRLVLEAKRLLYHSQKSIKEIAADLNYEDPSYFTKFFRTHTGYTPEQFRKHIREKNQ